MRRPSVWLLLAAPALLLAAPPGRCTDFDAVLREAKALTQTGRLLDAASVCLGVIDARPGSPYEAQARVLMGYILVRKSASSAETAEQFLAAAQGFPDTPEAAEALHCLGHLALRDHDPALAVERFDQSAANATASAEVRIDSAVEAAYAEISAYWKTKDRSALARSVERFLALRVKPVDNATAVRTRLGLGEAHLLVGFPESAAKDYREALDMGPPDAYSRGVAQYGIACALYTRREWAAAEAAFASFVAGLPGSDLQQKAQSWRAVVPGYAALAAADPDRAAKMSSVDAIGDAEYWRATCMLQLGRYREGKVLADQILIAFPKLKTAWRVRRLSQMCGIVTGDTPIGGGEVDAPEDRMSGGPL